jgi:hypothetical protein
MTIIWLTLSASPDNGPDEDNIENKMSFILNIAYFFPVLQKIIKQL